MNHLIVRVDATTQIGTGHIMRCLALAQAWWQTGGGVTFLTVPDSSMLENRLKSEGMVVKYLSARPGSDDDALETAALARKINASLIVLDGYQFSGSYQHALKDNGLNLLFVDDYGHADHYYADLVLNQNNYAHEGFYASREPYTKLLLGASYVLLRSEFLKRQGWQRRENPKVARKVLVTLGGCDPDNVTLKVISALKKVGISDLDVKIVVGPSNPNAETLQNALLFAPSAMRILQNVENMPDLMAWADMAISAGGSTCWELAFMGLPSLLLILVDNQVPLVEGLHAEGVALNLGWHHEVSDCEIGRTIERLTTAPEKRQKMARRGQSLVDGEGAGKVLNLMRKGTLTFRKAGQEDCRLLWEWTNSRGVRSVSFTAETIPWEEHVQWFSSKLSDPNCLFYIIKDGGGAPAGQVRYDLRDDEAVISISIDPKFRSRGYGSQAIRLLSQEVFNVADVKIIHAYVKQSNAISAGAFLKAGFKDIGTEIIHGHRAIDLALMKDAMI